MKWIWSTHMKLRKSSRSPHGERGLKLHCGGERGPRRPSLPARGAWIEIVMSCNRSTLIPCRQPLALCKKFIGTSRTRNFSLPGSFLLILSFQCVPDSLTGAADRFHIGVGVHSERDRRVAMAQAFTERNHIRPVCNGNAGGAMPEQMRMKTGHIVLLPKLFEVSRGALRVHGSGCPVLIENIF